MTLLQLLYFDTLARVLHYTRAAHRNGFYYTDAGVAQAISQDQFDFVSLVSLGDFVAQTGFVNGLSQIFAPKPSGRIQQRLLQLAQSINTF